MITKCEESYSIVVRKGYCAESENGLIFICKNGGDSLDRGDVIQLWHMMNTDGYNLDR